MHFTRPALLALALSGCKVVDAPASLEALVIYGFVHFDDDDAHPIAAVEGLRPKLKKNAAELVEGVRVQAMTAADLREAGLPAEKGTEIVGAAATVDYASDLDAIADAWSNRHMDRILPVAIDFEIRAERGDRACFLARDCESWSYDAWRQNDMGMFGTSEQTFTRDFRWLELDDGTVVLTARDLATEPAEISSGLVQIDQQYAWSVFLPAGRGTLRFDTFWVEARAVGVDIPDAFAVDLAVSSMAETAEAVDAWTGGGR